MDKTLYVSDLDGTLLTPEERISPFTRRVVNSLAAQGVAFTYATARSQHSADAVTAGLTKQLPVIVYNGVFVRQGEQRETLLHRAIPSQAREELEKAFAQQGLSPLVYTLLDGVERVLWRPDRETPGVAHYVSTRQGDERLLPVEDDRGLYRGEIFYYTLIGEREQLQPLWQQLQGNPTLTALLQEELYRPGEYWLEILSREASKASAARWLKQRLGCTRLVAFGDGLNDLPLFQEAQESCAVENARPEVQAAASQVIPGNERDGVARFLLADTAPLLALGDRAGAFRVRLYHPQDLEELIRLFYETVHTVKRQDYTQQEVDAWVPSVESVDRAAWGESLAAHFTVVAEQEGRLLGFGDMDDTGYLDRLYVHKDFQGRGVASALAQALEGYAVGLGVKELSVHASRTALPFFQGRGYVHPVAQKVLRRGVLLENFRLTRPGA